MTLKRALITLLLLVVAMAQSSDAALSFSDLQKQLDQKNAELQALMVKAEAKGIDTAYEQVAITTAKLFRKWAVYDHDNPERIRRAMTKCYFLKQDLEAYLRTLPTNELKRTIDVLDTAIEDLSNVIAKPESRRATVRLDHSKIVFKDDYLHIDDRPVFGSCFTWQPNDREIVEAYGKMGGQYVGMNYLDESETVFKQKLDSSNAFIGCTHFGHRPAKWLEKKYLGALDGASHFIAYDIDNPDVIRMVKKVIELTVPQLAGKRKSMLGHLLANEPHWFSGKNDWAIVHPSQHTMGKFRKWLEEKHRSISVLNDRWKADFSSFNTVEIELPIDPELQGQGSYYDWCLFNMSRVTDWFTMMKQELRKYHRDGRVCIKLIPGQFTSGNHRHGLNFEDLADLQDTLSCDAGMETISKIGSGPYRRTRPSWDKRYAANWRKLVITYDFYKTLYPKKPLYDSEYHAYSTVHWRELNMRPDYVRFALWLPHLHGMTANSAWYWGRSESGEPKSDTVSCAASFLFQPRMLYGYGKTMKELNAFSREIVALNRVNRSVRIFYSESTAISDPNYIERIDQTYRALYHRGLFMGLETARSLKRKGMAGVARDAVLILPGITFATPSDRDAIYSFVAAGGTVILAGPENLKKDEYSKPYPAKAFSVSGKVLRLAGLDEATMYDAVSIELAAKKLLPPVDCTESNAIGLYGCVWRATEYNKQILFVITNIGKSAATVTIKGRDGDSLRAHDLLGNTHATTSFELEPFGIRLLALHK